MQHKSIDLTDCGLKFAKGDDGTFEGYLSVFDRVDSYGDTVKKGAYEETLAGRKRMPPMLLNHDAFSIPIGVWKSMEEDDVGLRVVGELTKGNPVSEQAYASMKHGAMTGLSIGYRAVKFEENDHGGLDLHKIDLREGSVVSMPAEDEARIDVVKFEEMYGEIEAIKEFEWLLRDAGCSRKMANRLVSRFKELCQSDSDGLQDENQQLKQQVESLQRALEHQKRTARLKALV